MRWPALARLNGWSQDFAQDVRYTARALRASPGFAVTAVLTLAIGIGAATAMFSILDTVLVRALPVKDQDRLVLITKVLPKDGTLLAFNHSDLVAFRRQSRSFTAIAGTQYDGAWPYPVLDGDQGFLVSATLVSSDFFQVLGTAPIAGRLPAARDAANDGTMVGVITEGFWKRRYGGDASVIGRTLTVFGRERVRIVAVVPAGFEYPRGVELWVTPPERPSDAAENSGLLYSLVGRLRPGISTSGAEQETQALLKALEANYPVAQTTGLRTIVTSLHDAILGDTRPAMILLSAAVLLVLLIACANVTSLILVRAIGRERDLALRFALGADRSRIVRQTLTEGSIIASIAAVLGVVLAGCAVRVFGQLASADIPRAAEIRMDARVFAFSLAVCVGTTLLSALVPAAWSARREGHVALRSGSRVNRESTTVRRVKHALVAGQIALALMVLAGAGLLVRSLAHMQQQELGFAVDDAVVAQLPLLGAQYVDPARRLDLYDRLLQRLEATPGVTAATATIITPFAGDGGWTGTITVEGQSTREAAANPAMNLNAVLPNYFRTLAVPIRRGRAFTDADREGAVPVAIVSAALARRAWPGVDPIGKRLKLGAPDSPQGWMTVVGVAGDTRYRSLTTQMPTIYRPLRQWTPRPHFLIVRGTGGAGALARIVRDAVHTLDPAERIFDVTPMSRFVDQQLRRPRITTVVLSAYAMIALVLACIGLYGSMAALVAQQGKEMSIRRALGAQSRDISRLVLGRGMWLVTLGLGAGGIATASSTHLVGSLLYGVSPADPVALGTAVLVLTLAAVAACAIPTWRAARADPMVALRGE